MFKSCIFKVNETATTDQLGPFSRTSQFWKVSLEQVEPASWFHLFQVLPLLVIEHTGLYMSLVVLVA